MEIKIVFSDTVCVGLGAHAGGNLSHHEGNRREYPHHQLWRCDGADGEGGSALQPDVAEGFLYARAPSFGGALAGCCRELLCGPSLVCA